MAADLAAFGAPKELVARWADRAAGADQEDGNAKLFLVRPDCWTAVRLFSALETQWNWVGTGLAGAERTGLRYEAMEFTASMLKITVTPSLFADLRTMEGAALKELAVIAKERADRLDKERPKGKGRRGRGAR